MNLVCAHSLQALFVSFLVAYSHLAYSLPIISESFHIHPTSNHDHIKSRHFARLATFEELGMLLGTYPPTRFCQPSTYPKF